MFAKISSQGLRVAALLAVSVFFFVTSQPAAAQAPVFVSQERSNAAPLEIAREHIGRSARGLSGDDLAAVTVRDQYRSAHNGTTHIHFVQKLDGLEVLGTETNYNIAADGRIISAGDRLLQGLRGRAADRHPLFGAEQAIAAAAAHLGLPADAAVTMVDAPSGVEQRSSWSAPGVSRVDVPARLVFHRDGEILRLAWDLVVDTPDGQHLYNIWVDARTNAVISANDWVSSASYEVFALPKDSPKDGSRTVEVDPADAVASPFGWHDTNGAAGAEFTVTRGNNACAQDDSDGNNSACGTGFQPDGGTTLDFTGALVPLDLATQQPSEYTAAAVTQIFYSVNWFHDVLYAYGFDEVSGNFQENNYGRGGVGGDAVNVDVQENGGVGNFAPTPEGSPPRLQLGIFASPDSRPDRDGGLDTGVAAHEYCHGLSSRLTGGPSNANCLTGDQRASEGWSDFCTLFMAAKTGDQSTTPRGVGAYISFQDTGPMPGVRTFSYSTDLAVNPLMYGDISTLSVPHGVGTVWAAAVWEMYWNLVDDQGFDPDLLGGTAGNNVAIQLVVDGLKLQPCNPTFLDARDAILLADQNNNGGANECLIWQAFAKRGMGLSANDGGSASTRNVTEAFDSPAQCTVAGCGNGFCEAGEDCNSCPSDCVSGTAAGAVCGNGICEASAQDGEDCVSCPSDCNGVQGGKPAGRFCCGDGDGDTPVSCADSRCTTGGFACTEIPASGGSFCCGDLVCDSGESCSNCGLDCTLGAEVCDNGIDDDCDAFIDCDDSDCAAFPCGGGCVPTADKEKGPRCSDGLDNDCDGLIDAADPDC